jgi:3-deoxy-D-manno-octulosonic acid kinase
MVETQGHRLIVKRTPRGAVLFASSRLASLLESAAESIFDPEHWRARGALSATSQGRGSAWFVRSGGEKWVLRHYSRGGLVGRIVRDSYLWTGESRVRAFRELRLTQALQEMGLPVPAPVAAAYRRAGVSYRCDLITRRIEGAAALSARLAAAPLSADRWREIGAAIARFHDAGVDHADLNAHNILLGGAGGVSLIDFDRGCLRTAGAWRHDNMARLRRSLLKIQESLPADRFDPQCWQFILNGYHS